jgi:hypothetical protein
MQIWARARFLSPVSGIFFVFRHSFCFWRLIYNAQFRFGELRAPSSKRLVHMCGPRSMRYEPKANAIQQPSAVSAPRDDFFWEPGLS